MGSLPPLHQGTQKFPGYAFGQDAGASDVHADDHNEEEEEEEEFGDYDEECEDEYFKESLEAGFGM